jgi:hypothetical protein
VGDNTEVGHEGREWVVCDFGLGRTYRTKQSGLTRIRKANEPDVSEYLELEKEPAFAAFFTGLGVLWSLVDGIFEECVSAATTTTGQEDFALTCFGELAEYFKSFGIFDDGPERNLQDDVFTAATYALVAAAVDTRFGLDVLAVLKVNQGPHLGIRL